MPYEATEDVGDLEIDVRWRFTLVYLVYRQVVLVYLTLLVEGHPPYKPSLVGDCPLLLLFERLSAITLLLDALIVHLSQMEVVVYKPTLP